MDKIYVVYESHLYEGCAVYGLYDNLHDARKAADEKQEYEVAEMPVPFVGYACFYDYAV